MKRLIEIVWRKVAADTACEYSILIFDIELGLHENQHESFFKDLGFQSLALPWRALCHFAWPCSPGSIALLCPYVGVGVSVCVGAPQAGLSGQVLGGG